MRTVVQRVRAANVLLTETGETRPIGPGLVVLVGVAHADTPADADWMADKIVSVRVFEDADGKMNLSLRVFEDADGKMNLSLLDTGGAMLIVSQFTLLGDARRGRRPSFAGAAPPAVAVPLYEQFVARVRAAGVPVQTGEFGAEMLVALENDGPVTLIINSP